MFDGRKSPTAIKILIVDDIEDTRKNIRIILSFERDFHVVGMAANGREAVDLAIRLQPDVILMNINMPEMDGIHATNQITETVPTAAIIILTAEDDPEWMRHAMLAGARDYLLKPPDIDELYNNIRRAYELHRRYYARVREIILTEERLKRPGTGETIEPN